MRAEKLTPIEQRKGELKHKIMNTNVAKTVTSDSILVNDMEFESQQVITPKILTDFAWVGRIGDWEETHFSKTDTVLRIDWGSSIYDSDMKTAQYLLSLCVKEGEPLLTERVNSVYNKEVFTREEKDLQFIDSTGKTLYKGVFIIDLSSVSKKLKRRPMHIYKSIEKLSYVRVRVKQGAVTFSYPFFRDVSIDESTNTLRFSISNALLRESLFNKIAFKNDEILLLKEFTYRMYFYIASHQRPSFGKKMIFYVPKNTYTLDELLRGLRLNGTAKSNKRVAIARIKKGFEDIKKAIPDFPKFTYNSRKEVFENEFKNGKIDV